MIYLFFPSVDQNYSFISFQASRKTKKKEGGAKRAQRASSNVFSNFEQTQIQEFKEVRQYRRCIYLNETGHRYRIGT